MAGAMTPKKAPPALDPPAAAIADSQPSFEAYTVMPTRRPSAGRDRLRGLHHLNAVLAGNTAELGEQLDWHTSTARGVRPLAWSHAELIVTLLLAAPIG